MAYQVDWSPSALDDVASIAAYIAEDSEFYAAAVVQKIFLKARQLSSSPRRGRIVPEYGNEDVREIFAYNTGSSIRSTVTP
jgi:toxin ParE1/3/4